MLEELRAEVLATCLRMVADQVAHGAQGNISAMDPATGLLAITPTAIPYNEMTADDIAVIDKNGNVVEGRWRPTSETPMHTLFYRERPDVRAVVHSHAPYATVFAIINQPIPVVLIESAACLGAPVEVAPYRQPGTEEVGRIAKETMGKGVAVLLANHGLLTVGENLSQAYDSTIAAETTARLVIMARSMNAVPIEMEPGIVTGMRQSYLERYRPVAVA